MHPAQMEALLNTIEIEHVSLRDIRFPTSQTREGSDARSQDPDYSLVYCTLSASNTAHKGVGIAFSLGRGNELLLAAGKLLQREVVNLKLSSCWNNFADVWRRLVGSRDGQLLWVGVDKAVVHQAGVRPKRTPCSRPFPKLTFTCVGHARERRLGPVGQGRRNAPLEARDLATP